MILKCKIAECRTLNAECRTVGGLRPHPSYKNYYLIFIIFYLLSCEDNYIVVPADELKWLQESAGNK